TVRKMFRERADAGNDATNATQSGVRRVSIGKTAVNVAPDKLASALRTNAVDKSSARAVAVANALADELIKVANSPNVATFNRSWSLLDAQRVQLAALEHQLNQQLTDELAAHSPNAGATDAAHQAVLREQSDVQQRILKLDESRPTASILTVLTPARAIK